MKTKTIKDAVVTEDEVQAALVPVKPQARWEHKTEFGVNTQMRSIIDLSIKVAEAEIDSYRRKLDKLTYGS
jgi:hypothetical protein